MGRGRTAPSTQTVEQTNLPGYAEPFFTELLQRTQALTDPSNAYTPYPGQRQAAFTPDMESAFDLTRQVAGQGIAGLPQAMGATAGNLQAAQSLAQRAGQRAQFSEFSPTQFQGFQAGSGTAFEYDPARQFTDAGVIESYMSPYIANVLDYQTSQAAKQFREQGAQRATQAARAGAFGGSRQAVQSAIAERDLLDRMAGIEATGMQNAFQQAAQMFGQDRAAQMAQQQAQAAELARVQGIDVAEAARVQQSRAAEMARAQQIQAAERARVEGGRAADLRAGQQAELAALGFAGQQAQQLAGLGEMGRAADIQNAQLLENIGRTQMAQEQQRLDLAYQDFVRQQAYPEQQLQLYSSILRGVPVEPSITTTAYTPYNPIQQLIGGGATLAGISGYLSRKEGGVVGARAPENLGGGLGAIALYRGLQA